MAPLIVREEDCGLKILHEPQQTSTADPIDVVAVHGLGAHPDYTWNQLRAPGLDYTKPESYISWLEDETMLPATLPQARIMRYGYQSNWFGDNRVHTRTSQISDKFLNALEEARENCPKRPIIFISHSFGGLVVLRALVQTRENYDRWESIFDRVMGLVFFGTPFRGAHGSLSQAEILQLATEHMAIKANTGNIRVMQVGDESLEDLVDDYLRGVIEDGVPFTVCFYEQVESDVGKLVDASLKGVRKELLVNKSSGTLDVVHESVRSYPRACDHFSLNKFSGPKLEDWKFLARMLKKMIEEYIDLSDDDSEDDDDDDDDSEDDDDDDDEDDEDDDDDDE